MATSHQHNPRRLGDQANRNEKLEHTRYRKTDPPPPHAPASQASEDKWGLSGAWHGQGDRLPGPSPAEKGRNVAPGNRMSCWRRANRRSCASSSGQQELLLRWSVAGAPTRVSLRENGYLRAKQTAAPRGVTVAGAPTRVSLRENGYLRAKQTAAPRGVSEAGNRRRLLPPTHVTARHRGPTHVTV
ncbi:unnamed protein product [Boreogadus saida]